MIAQILAGDQDEMFGAIVGDPIGAFRRRYGFGHSVHRIIDYVLSRRTLGVSIPHGESVGGLEIAH